MNEVSIVQDPYWKLSYEFLLNIQGSRSTTALGRPFVVKTVIKKEDKAILVTSKGSEFSIKISDLAKCFRHLFEDRKPIMGIHRKDEYSIENIIGSSAVFSAPYFWGLLVRHPDVERKSNHVLIYRSNY